MTSWTQETLSDSGTSTSTTTPSTSWITEIMALDISGSSLTVDSIKIDGNTIGHTDDTDLLTLSNSILQVGGVLTVASNLIVSGDITCSGNNFTFGNAESIYNTTDGQLDYNAPVHNFVAGPSGTGDLIVKFKPSHLSDTNALVLFTDIFSPAWSIGKKASDMSLYFDAAVAVPGAATKLKLDNSGNLTVTGQFGCNGQTPATAPNWTVSNKTGTTRTIDCDGTDTAVLAENVGQLVNDLIAIGILQ